MVKLKKTQEKNSSFGQISKGTPNYAIFINKYFQKGKIFDVCRKWYWYFFQKSRKKTILRVKKILNHKEKTLGIWDRIIVFGQTVGIFRKTQGIFGQAQGLPIKSQVRCLVQSTLGFATIGKAANLGLATRNTVTDLF